MQKPLARKHDRLRARPDTQLVEQMRETVRTVFSLMPSRRFPRCSILQPGASASRVREVTALQTRGRTLA